MRGHVRKRGSTWAIVYDEGRDAEGKRRQRWRGGFKTRRDANRALAEVLSRLDTGSYVQPSRTPLLVYLEGEWLPAVTGTVRPATARRYAQAVKLHVAPRPLAGVPLQSVSAGHLNGLYAELAAEGAAPATVRFAHAVLHRAFRDAVKWGRLTRNPADAADPPRVGRRRSSVWTARETSAFLRAVEGDRLAALWRLAATTGMRRGEVLGVRWLDVDLKAARLTVSQSIVPGPRGSVEVSEPKTTAGRRTIALDAATVAALREHRETQRLERDVLGPGYQDQDLVFAREDGAPIQPNRLTDWFVARVRAAGLPPIRLHDLRHGWATLALSRGVPVHVVSARLGHSDAAVTLRVYAHLLAGSDSDAAETVAELLSG